MQHFNFEGRKKYFSSLSNLETIQESTFEENDLHEENKNKDKLYGNMPNSRQLKTTSNYTELQDIIDKYKRNMKLDDVKTVEYLDKKNYKDVDSYEMHLFPLTKMKCIHYGAQENMFKNKVIMKTKHFGLDEIYPRKTDEDTVVDSISKTSLDSHFEKALKDMKLAILNLREEKNCNHFLKYYTEFITNLKSNLENIFNNWNELKEITFNGRKKMDFHQQLEKKKKLKLINTLPKLNIEMQPILKSQKKMLTSLIDNRLQPLQNNKSQLILCNRVSAKIQEQDCNKVIHFDAAFHDNELALKLIGLNQVEDILPLHRDYFVPNIALIEDALYICRNSMFSLTTKVLQMIPQGRTRFEIMIENERINCKRYYKSDSCSYNKPKNSTAINKKALQSKKLVHFYKMHDYCTIPTSNSNLVEIVDIQANNKGTETDFLTSKCKELENLQRKNEMNMLHLQEVKDRCEELQNQLRIKEELLLNTQAQNSCLYMELDRKNCLVNQWQGEINYLYTCLNQREESVKEIYRKNVKIYEMEQQLNHLQELLDEKNLVLKYKENQIDSLCAKNDERSSVNFRLKNELAEKEMAANFLQIIHFSLTKELQERESQCEKLLIRLNNVNNDLQEMKQVKKSIQIQLADMQKCVDNLLLEKEELECNMFSYQQETSSLKEEFEKLSREIPSYKEELNYVRTEIESLTAELGIKKLTILKQQASISELNKTNEYKESEIQMLKQQLSIYQKLTGQQESSIRSSGNGSKKLMLDEKLEQEETTLKLQLEKNKNTIKKLQIKSEEKDGQIQFLHTLLIAAQNAMKKDDEKGNSLYSQNSNSSEKSGCLENKLQLMEHRLKKLQKENEANQHQIAVLGKKLETDKQMKQTKDLYLFNLRSQVVNLQKNLHQAIMEKDEKNMDITMLHSQMQSLQNKIGEFQKDIKDKDSVIDMLQSEMNNLHDEVEIFREINKLKEEKIELLIHQLNDTRIELDKREMMISNMQAMINEYQKNEMEKNDSMKKLNLKLAKSLSFMERFPFIIHYLQCELKRLKSKMSMKNVSNDFVSSLFRIEHDIWQNYLHFTELKGSEFASAFHTITEEKLKLQDKYKAKMNLRKQLENITSSESLSDIQVNKLQCLDLEIKILNEEMMAKDKALLMVIERQKKAERETCLVEKQMRKCRNHNH